MSVKLKFLLASTIILILIGAYAFAAESEGKTEQKSLEPNSVYQLKVNLENQLAESVALNQYQGHPTLVTMFYASCPHVCPMLISTITLTESKLTPGERAELRVLAVSIDPERDTPKLLKQRFEDHSLDGKRWTLTRPELDQVRLVASVLGVKYKQLPSGEFSHSTKIILLDRGGVEVASTNKLGGLDSDFLAEIKAALK